MAGAPLGIGGAAHQLGELLGVQDRLGDAPDQNGEEHCSGDLFKGMLP